MNEKQINQKYEELLIKAKADKLTEKEEEELKQLRLETEVLSKKIEKKKSKYQEPETNDHNEIIHIDENVVKQKEEWYRQFLSEKDRGIKRKVKEFLLARIPKNWQYLKRYIMFSKPSLEEVIDICKLQIDDNTRKYEDLFEQKIIPRHWKNYYNFLGYALSVNPKMINYLDMKYKTDPELAKEVVKINGLALEYLKVEESTTLHIPEEAVYDRKGNLVQDRFEFATELSTLQNNKEVVMEAIKENPAAIKYASYELQDDEEIKKTAQIFEDLENIHSFLENNKGEIDNFNNDNYEKISKAKHFTKEQKELMIRELRDSDEQELPEKPIRRSR